MQQPLDSAHYGGKLEGTLIMGTEKAQPGTWPGQQPYARVLVKGLQFEINILHTVEHTGKHGQERRILLGSSEATP